MAHCGAVAAYFVEIENKFKNLFSYETSRDQRGMHQLPRRIDASRKKPRRFSILTAAETAIDMKQ
jgi:hypothetical protein